MNEFQNVLKGREAIYRMLARIYRVEVDQDLLKQLQKFKFPTDTENAVLTEGANELAEIAKQEDINLDLLAADYAHTFLAAGIPRGQVAFPFESVYTSPQKLVMQDAYEQVYKILAAHGLASKAKDIYADHLSIELEFMAYLCAQAYDDVEKGDNEALSKNLDEQKSFLEKHLLNWVPEFCADIKHWSEQPFYQAVGKITAGFMQLEKEYFEGT